MRTVHHAAKFVDTGFTRANPTGLVYYRLLN